MSRHLGAALTAFVDGELGHAQREEVLVHLTHCAGCRSEVDLLRGLKSALRGEPCAPEDLADRILASRILADRILASRILATAARPGQPVRVPRAPSARPGLLASHARVRRTAFGLGALALGVGGALAVAGPPPGPPRPPVDPTSAGFVLEHTSTANEVPFAGTATNPTIVPATNPATNPLPFR